MATPAVSGGLLGRNRGLTARFVGTGIALGALFGVGLGLYESALPQPVAYAVAATDGWVLWLLFVGVPALVAYENDGIVACWLFNLGMLVPFFLLQPTTTDYGDVAASTTVSERLVLPLVLAILFGSLAFFLGVGARWLGSWLRSDTATDTSGLGRLVVGANRRRAVATSLAGIVPGMAVVLAYGFDVPLLNRAPAGPDVQTLHWLLVGCVLLFTAAAAYTNDGLVPAWLLAAGFLAVVYASSYAESYGTGQALFSAFFSGVTFGSVGFLLGILARWIVTWRRSPLPGGEPS